MKKIASGIGIMITGAILVLAAYLVTGMIHYKLWVIFAEILFDRGYFYGF